MRSIGSSHRIVFAALLAVSASLAQAENTAPASDAAASAQAAAQAAAAKAASAAKAATDAAEAAHQAAMEAADAQAKADALAPPGSHPPAAEAPAAVATLAPPTPGVEAGVEARAIGDSSSSLQVVEEITPFTMSPSDRELTMKVIDIIGNDPKMKGHIAVSAINGVVQLSGSVKSVPMIYRAVELTRRLGDYKVNVDRLDKKSFF